MGDSKAPDQNSNFEKHEKMHSANDKRIVWKATDEKVSSLINFKPPSYKMIEKAQSLQPIIGAKDNAFQAHIDGSERKTVETNWFDLST